MANRDRYANIGEAVSVIMANSLHTNKSSAHLVELKLRRDISKLYQRLLEGTYADQNESKHCVCFSASAATLNAIRLDDSYKALVLDVLMNQPNREQAISEKDFVNQIAERLHRT